MAGLKGSSYAAMTAVGRDSRPRTHHRVLVPHAAAVPELQSLTDSEGPARWAAFVALGYSSDPSAAESLIRSTYSADWEVRRAACEALGFRVRGGPAALRVSELLDDPVPAVKRSACSVVGAFRDRGSRQRIFALLDSRDEATRHAAVAAIDRLWEPKDSTRLLEIARSDPSKEVSGSAAAVLLRHVEESSWRRLFDAWIDHPAARHRVSACVLATRFGDASSVDRIAPLRIDPDCGVRNAAETALATLRNVTPDQRAAGVVSAACPWRFEREPKRIVPRPARYQVSRAR
jgi:HEAT repeat protein